MTARSRERAGKVVRHAGSILVFAGLLAGCHGDAYYDSLAPSPTLNPHPHKVSHLKITVEPGSGVNRVEVYSIWVIGNLDCAPRRWPSGSTIQKQVAVKETVDHVGGHYLATIRKDYYLSGKCSWNTDGTWVKLFHNDILLASTGEASGDLVESNVIKLVCMPPPQAPLCELSKLKETFDRTHFTDVFDATLEIEP